MVLYLGLFLAGSKISFFVGSFSEKNENGMSDWWCMYVIAKKDYFLLNSDEHVIFRNFIFKSEENVIPVQLYLFLNPKGTRFSGMAELATSSNKRQKFLLLMSLNGCTKQVVIYMSTKNRLLCFKGLAQRKRLSREARDATVPNSCGKLQRPNLRSGSQQETALIHQEQSEPSTVVT